MIAENVVTLVNLMIILRMYGILYKQLENFDVKSLIFHEYLECIYRYDILSLGSSIRNQPTYPEAHMHGKYNHGYLESFFNLASRISLDVGIEMILAHG